jgi:nucleoid-associated protein YgaU
MMKKSVRESVIIVLALLLLISFAGCAKPPTNEMSEAKMAFQAATDADAQKYAPDKYMSAEEALNQANQLMEQKKYKQARKKALEALKLSREAEAASATSRNTASLDAKEMYDLALAAVNSANQAGADTYAQAQMRDARNTLAEAKKTYDAGDYQAAKQLAEAALEKARAAEAAAKQEEATRQAQAAQQAAEIAGPAAQPRPYPTEHVVIKGESLWWIAEYKQIYDDPFQWPLIYKANRSKIKDPDLIFPDQVFTITRPPELTDDMIKEAIKFAKNRGAWSLHDGK